MPEGIGYNPYTSLRMPSIDSSKLTNPVFFNPYPGYDPNQITNQFTSPDTGANGTFQMNPADVVGSGLNFAASLYGIFDNQTLDPLIQQPTIDPDNPILDTSTFRRNIAANSDAEARAAGNAGILSGFASGAKLGGSIGGVPGGLIGGGLGLITGLFGKGKRRREARKQRREAERLQRDYISNYNKALEADILSDSVQNRIRQQRSAFPTSINSLI